MFTLRTESLSPSRYHSLSLSHPPTHPPTHPHSLTQDGPTHSLTHSALTHPLRTEKRRRKSRASRQCSRSSFSLPLTHTKPKSLTHSRTHSLSTHSITQHSLSQHSLTRSLSNHPLTQHSLTHPGRRDAGGNRTQRGCALAPLSLPSHTHPTTLTHSALTHSLRTERRRQKSHAARQCSRSCVRPQRHPGRVSE